MTEVGVGEAREGEEGPEELTEVGVVVGEA